jgi:hypothetical protein
MVIEISCQGKKQNKGVARNFNGPNLMLFLDQTIYYRDFSCKGLFTTGTSAENM